MKILGTFSNAGEAGFVQSLLADAEILSELHDGSLDLGGVRGARLHVSDEDFGRASEIVANYRASIVKDPAEKKDVHPAAGFPFLGIMGFTAILWFILSLIYIFVHVPATELWRDGILKVSVGVLAIAPVSLLYGLIIGLVVALLCLVAKVTWLKLKSA